MCSFSVVTCFATHIGFIHLCHIVKMRIIVLYVMADTVQHEPCGFLCHLNIFRQLATAYAFLCERNK